MKQGYYEVRRLTDRNGFDCGAALYFNGEMQQEFRCESYARRALIDALLRANAEQRPDGPRYFDITPRNKEELRNAYI